MRRLVPFLIAAVMASFPSSFLLLLIGPLIISSGGGISCTGHCNNGGGALTGVAATSAVMASTPSRSMMSSATTVATAATAVMMASSSSRMASAEVKINVISATTEPMVLIDGRLVPVPPNRISNHDEIISLDENQRLKVEVLGGSPHCTFSMVEFTNTVSCLVILL